MIKDIGEYQARCRRTMDLRLSDRDALLNYAIGLVGEAGEVINEIKKVVFHGHGVDKRKLREELGDTLFYMCALCETLEISMGDVTQDNVDKLLKRYPEGFSQQASRERVI